VLAGPASAPATVERQAVGGASTASSPFIETNSLGTVGKATKLPLPKDCEYLSIDGTTASVVLCRPPEETFIEKLTKDSPSLLLSALTICVSIYAFGISGRQQRIGLVHSIKDEYWLREVISPTCISPLLSLRVEVLRLLDGVTNLGGAQDSIRSINRLFQEFTLQLPNLSLLDDGLVPMSLRKMELAEDLAHEYLGEVMGWIEASRAGAMPDATMAKAEISSQLYGCLQAIQEHQVKQLGGDRIYSRFLTILKKLKGCLFKASSSR